MAITDIGNQKTPSVPIEINISDTTGIPSANQIITLFGHAASTMAASAAYVPYQLSNNSLVSAASTEMSALYGASSELTAMVVAAVNANAGADAFPTINVIPLLSTDTDFGGGTNVGLNSLNTLTTDFVVSPYDGASAGTSGLRVALQTQIQTMSGATRTDNQQFGSFGVIFNRSVAASGATQLPAFDTQNLIGCWLPDSGTGAQAPVYTVPQSAAACAAVIAQQGVPFNPLDRVVINSLPAPAKTSDWITVGGGLESEAALNQGWTPLRVNQNGQVAFVRTVTGRITNGSGVTVLSYIDVQDWQVLYYWRKTLWTRFSQPDFSNVKASVQVAQFLLSEVIRLAKLFEDNQMFQAVQQLSQQIVVERNATDRSRFDVQVPTNVIPGLHEIAVNVIGTTIGDSFVVTV
jgi:phage tail sheath gpL-like